MSEAAKALSQLMIVAPDDARVVGEYGKVLTQLGRPGDALPFLNRAIQLDANDWTLYSALGVAYDQADQHTKAHAAYERALALKPGQPDVLNNMGVSRMLAGNLGDAQKLLNQACAARRGAAEDRQQSGPARNDEAGHGGAQAARHDAEGARGSGCGSGGFASCAQACAEGKAEAGHRADAAPAGRAAKADPAHRRRRTVIAADVAGISPSREFPVIRDFNRDFEKRGCGSACV